MVGLLRVWHLGIPKSISLWSDIKSRTSGLSRSTVEASLVIIWYNRLPLWWVGSDTHCISPYVLRHSGKVALFGTPGSVRFTFKSPRIRGSIYLLSR